MAKSKRKRGPLKGGTPASSRKWAWWPEIDRSRTRLGSAVLVVAIVCVLLLCCFGSSMQFAAVLATRYVAFDVGEDKTIGSFAMNNLSSLDVVHWHSLVPTGGNRLVRPAQTPEIPLSLSTTSSMHTFGDSIVRELNLSYERGAIYMQFTPMPTEISLAASRGGLISIDTGLQGQEIERRQSVRVSVEEGGWLAPKPAHDALSLFSAAAVRVRKVEIAFQSDEPSSLVSGEVTEIGSPSAIEIRSGSSVLLDGELRLESVIQKDGALQVHLSGTATRFDVDGMSVLPTLLSKVRALYAAFGVAALGLAGLLFQVIAWMSAKKKNDNA